jgi:hypothetical protein
VDCLIADLIYQARSKLDLLGKEFGLLPKNENLEATYTPTETNTNGDASNTNTTNTTANSSPVPNPNPEELSPIKSSKNPTTCTFSNPTLQEAMQSETTFDKLYIGIIIEGTSRQIICYVYRYDSKDFRAVCFSQQITQCSPVEL